MASLLFGCFLSDTVVQVKAVNLVRNKLIASGLEGGLSVSTEKFLLEQSWEFEVDGESEQVVDVYHRLLK